MIDSRQRTVYLAPVTNFLTFTERVKNVKEPALRPLVYTKERYKRATNQHAASPTSTLEQKQVNDQKSFIQMLKNDPGFLANLEKVFTLDTVRNKTDRSNRTASVPTSHDDNKYNSGKISNH